MEVLPIGIENLLESDTAERVDKIVLASCGAQGFKSVSGVVCLGSGFGQFVWQSVAMTTTLCAHILWGHQIRQHNLGCC